MAAAAHMTKSLSISGDIQLHTVLKVKQSGCFYQIMSGIAIHGSPPEKGHAASVSDFD
jgi:hypothetical protein